MKNASSRSPRLSLSGAVTDHARVLEFDPCISFSPPYSPFTEWMLCKNRFSSPYSLLWSSMPSVWLLSRRRFCSFNFSWVCLKEFEFRTSTSARVILRRLFNIFEEDSSSKIFVDHTVKESYNNYYCPKAT